MTGCKEIAGVRSVRIEQSENRLVLRFDPQVTTRERVIAAVQVVVDNIH